MGGKRALESGRSTPQVHQAADAVAGDRPAQQKRGGLGGAVNAALLDAPEVVQDSCAARGAGQSVGT